MPKPNWEPEQEAETLLKVCWTKNYHTPLVYSKLSTGFKKDLAKLQCSKRGLIDSINNDKNFKPSIVFRGLFRFLQNPSWNLFQFEWTHQIRDDLRNWFPWGIRRWCLCEWSPFHPSWHFSLTFFHLFRKTANDFVFKLNVQNVLDIMETFSLLVCFETANTLFPRYFCLKTGKNRSCKKCRLVGRKVYITIPIMLGDEI